jgi:hypothetical protein
MAPSGRRRPDWPGLRPPPRLSVPVNRLVRPLTRPVGLALVIAAVVALTAASCSYTNPPVMSMAKDGKETPFFTMSWDDLQKKLDAATASTGAGTTTVPVSQSATQIASVLTNTAREEAVKQIVTERKITTTDADTAAAQAQSQQQSSTGQPQDIEVQIAALERSLAEEAFASGKFDQDAQARELFDANKTTYATPAQVCLHVIGIAPDVDQSSTTGTPTDAELQAAVAKANATRARI